MVELVPELHIGSSILGFNPPDLKPPACARLKMFYSYYWY
jgi:hypothetical protein